MTVTRICDSDELDECLVRQDCILMELLCQNTSKVCTAILIICCHYTWKPLLTINTKGVLAIDEWSLLFQVLLGSQFTESIVNSVDVDD